MERYSIIMLNPPIYLKKKPFKDMMGWEPRYIYINKIKLTLLDILKTFLLWSRINIIYDL